MKYIDITLSGRRLDITPNGSTHVEVTLQDVDEDHFYELVDMDRLILSQGIDFVLQALDVDWVKNYFDLKDNNETD